MAEVVRRVTERFPKAVLDRERGDRLVQQHVAWLIELRAPSVIVDNWRALVGQVAYVTVSEEGGKRKLGFLLLSQPSLITVEYDRPEDRAACKPVVEALAAALDYEIVTEDQPE